MNLPGILLSPPRRGLHGEYRVTANRVSPWACFLIPDPSGRVLARRDGHLSSTFQYMR
jgi:hypothetical protein